LKLTYQRIKGDVTLEVHSDAGFKKEVDQNGHAEGKAAKGANYILRSSKLEKTNRVHLLDWVVGMIKQVTRSTFTSETSAVIMAADRAMTIRTTLEEIHRGPIKLSSHTPTVLKARTDTPHAIKIVLVTDALNLLLALDTPHVKPPAEQSFLLNLLWLKNLLQERTVHSLSWCDTRDMSADGHTKGSISRELLIALIGGILKVNHERKSLSYAKEANSQGKRMCVERPDPQWRKHGSEYSSDNEGDGPTSLTRLLTNFKVFELFGLGDLTAGEVKKIDEAKWESAYRNMSRIIHPDKTGDPKDGEKFVLLTELRDHIAHHWPNRSWRTDFLMIHSKRQDQDFKVSASIERLRQHDIEQAEGGHCSGGKAKFVHPGVFAVQQALNQSLQARARSKTVTASSESRIVAYEASLDLQRNRCRPVPVAQLPRALRNEPEEKQKHIDANQRVLFDATIQRKTLRMLDRRQKDINRCNAAGRQYTGRSKWKIQSKMARSWRRTAALRSRLETNPETRRLITASKHVNRSNPDERVADEEAVKRGRREAAEWRPPIEKPMITKRKWQSGSNRRRKRRKLLRDTPATPLAITWTPPSGKSEPTLAQDINDDNDNDNGEAKKRRRRGKRRSGKESLPQAMPVGRVRSSVN